MSRNTDILILGATGFTGRLVTKQLNAHRDRTSFTFALGARSHSKLVALVEELDLSAQVPLVVVDVTSQDDVERAVKRTKVVINTVGPYWNWGTPVVRACARNGVHYIDLTGETPWIKDIISEFDFLASKTNSVIVPSCGFDSVPSDLAAYLSVGTLKDHLGADTEVGRSVTAHAFKGGVSGGSLSSMYTSTAEIPRQKLVEALRDHSLSPAAGGFFPMAPINRAVVLRTRGLFQVHPSMKPISYGSKFHYEEFLVTRNRLAGALLSLGVFAISFCFGASRIVPWLFKRFVVPNVHGPSDQTMENGFLKTTNVTSSIPTSRAPEIHAKTVIKVRGDPGYLCTCVMLAEMAIALLDVSKLTPLARQGGVLTPVSAFGDELPKRLEASGRFEFESSILGR